MDQHYYLSMSEMDRKIYDTQQQAMDLEYAIRSEGIERDRKDEAKMRKDAERYRWLRHGDNDEAVLHFTNDARCGTDSVWILRGGDLDAAIDSELAKEQS